jgi:hypothetical protein
VIRTGALVAFTGLMLTLGAGSARPASMALVSIHIHLNAYAHWGHCTKPGSITAVDSSTYEAKCAGTQGAEIGVIAGREHFLAHGAYCHFDWVGSELTVYGTDVKGGTWRLKGTKDHNWTRFAIHEGQIIGKSVTTGTTGPVGTPDGPLAVDMSKHYFYKGITLENGYSLDLRGYVHIA